MTNYENNEQNNIQNVQQPVEMKFCKHCGEKINKDAVVCIHCGLDVSDKRNEQIVINNTVTNSNVNQVPGILYRSKWVAIALCVFLGVLGGHKFYERKYLMGILYLFTGGLLGVGVVYDLIKLIFKPNPYLVV